MKTYLNGLGSEKLLYFLQKLPTCKSGQLRGGETRQDGGHAPLDGGLCQPGAGGGPQLGGVPVDGAQLGGVPVLDGD